MKVDGIPYRTVWMKGSTVYMIDQTKLPFEFDIVESRTCRETCKHIKNMTVRGAGAIGATAGFAMAQACLEYRSRDTVAFVPYVLASAQFIKSTRPTAQNLFYAVERVLEAVRKSNKKDYKKAAFREAQSIADEDSESCRMIGEHGAALIRDGMNIETHCNAGWLAFVDYGSALSPVYVAHRSGKKVHVWVDETRPRGQGARLTAWELKNEGVPYTVIPDNAAATVISKGKVNLIIVGADRIAANGDTANKLGTHNLATIAHEYGVPFYVAAPMSTFDLECRTGDSIPIEERSEEEVTHQTGPNSKGNLEKILVCCPGSNAFNPSFDVTPAKFIKGIITEKGVVGANCFEILSLFGKRPNEEELDEF